MAETIKWRPFDSTEAVDVDETNGFPVRLVQRTPATATSIASGTGDVAFAVAPTAGLVLLGLSTQEDAASTASFIVRIGGAAGTPAIYVKLASGESTRPWYGPDGIDASAGVSLDRVSGTTSVVLYTAVIG